jgi:hypothetical protein
MTFPSRKEHRMSATRTAHKTTVKTEAARRKVAPASPKTDTPANGTPKVEAQPKAVQS